MVKRAAAQSPAFFFFFRKKKKKQKEAKRRTAKDFHNTANSTGKAAWFGHSLLERKGAAPWRAGKTPGSHSRPVQTGVGRDILVTTDRPEPVEAPVALALLPDGVTEGSRLLWENLEYTIIG